MKSNGSVLEDYCDHRDPPEPDAMFNLSGRGNHTLEVGLIPPPNGTPSFMPGGGKLDMKTGSSIMDLLLRLNREDGKTLVMVTLDERIGGKLTEKST